MAVQATSNFTYNYGTYTTPYFRLVTHLPLNGSDTPVDCFMYASQPEYTTGGSYIACFPFYVSNANAPYQLDANNVVNQYLLFVTEQITGSLEAMSPGTTFQIVEIPASGSQPDPGPEPEPTPDPIVPEV